MAMSFGFPVTTLSGEAEKTARRVTLAAVDKLPGLGDDRPGSVDVWRFSSDWAT